MRRNSHHRPSLVGTGACCAGFIGRAEVQTSTISPEKGAFESRTAVLWWSYEIIDRGLARFSADLGLDIGTLLDTSRRCRCSCSFLRARLR